MINELVYFRITILYNHKILYIHKIPEYMDRKKIFPHRRNIVVFEVGRGFGYIFFYLYLYANIIKYHSVIFFWLF